MPLSLCRFLYINANDKPDGLGVVFRTKIVLEIQEFAFFKKFLSEFVQSFHISNTFCLTVSLNINEFSGRNHVKTVMISVI